MTASSQSSEAMADEWTNPKTVQDVVAEVEDFFGAPVAEIVRNDNWSWSASGLGGDRGIRLHLPNRYGDLPHDLAALQRREP